MKKKKTVALRYKKVRAILSDVLPYELPITFSNRHFYDFIVKNDIHLVDGVLHWIQKDDATDTLIKVIFGSLDIKIATKTIIKSPGEIAYNYFDGTKAENGLITIPFAYKISHKETDYRELTICHPRNQLRVADFYYRYKETIIYHCSQSPFSIRKPSRIAKLIYHKDGLHKAAYSSGQENIEEEQREYESLKTFFVYKDFSNVYKFYESYRYHRCEKKYSRLLKLDISKCFDSIYTHALPWALINKATVKKFISDNPKLLDHTFSHKFDELIRNLNSNETNGIIIGPEFSRIFAELILQAVDVELFKILKDEHKLIFQVDYEIYRYVDDYFVFYTKEEDKDKILETLQFCLRKYNLYLNSGKAITYDKPIITEISIAKDKIAKLLTKNLSSDIVIETEKVNSDQSELNEVAPLPKFSAEINSKALIIQFKTIIKECKVEYKDMLNYSLAIIERKTVLLIEQFDKSDKSDKSLKKIVKALLEILDFVFFIYAVSPRVNTTIKLCRIIKIITIFFSGLDKNLDYAHIACKKIYDDVSLVLKQNRSRKFTQVETLYLLTVLSDLGKEFWLDQNVLANYFGMTLSDDKLSFKTSYDLNYLSIVVLLFYMRDKVRYKLLRSTVMDLILKKMSGALHHNFKDTESTLLLLDTLACPYIDTSIKTKLLTDIGITDATLQAQVITKRAFWFTKWTNFQFEKELDAKRSQEVY